MRCWTEWSRARWASRPGRRTPFPCWSATWTAVCCCSFFSFWSGKYAYVSLFSFVLVSLLAYSTKVLNSKDFVLFSCRSRFSLIALIICDIVRRSPFYSRTALDRRLAIRAISREFDSLPCTRLCWLTTLFLVSASISTWPIFSFLNRVKVSCVNNPPTIAKNKR